MDRYDVRVVFLDNAPPALILDVLRTYHADGAFTVELQDGTRRVFPLCVVREVSLVPAGAVDAERPIGSREWVYATPGHKA